MQYSQSTAATVADALTNNAWTNVASVSITPTGVHNILVIGTYKGDGWPRLQQDGSTIVAFGGEQAGGGTITFVDQVTAAAHTFTLDLYTDNGTHDYCYAYSLTVIDLDS